MVRFILRWAINAIALYVGVVVVNNTIGGINVTPDTWQNYLWMGLIFGFVNALLRPLLKILTCPLIILTLGLFTLLINTFLFYVVGYLGTLFGMGYTIANFWSALLAAVVISIVSILMSLVLRDELRGRRRKR
jgi:putative membrane protein